MDLLPEYSGLLPYWLLFISVTSFGNSISTLFTLYGTSQVYDGPSSPTPPSLPPSPSMAGDAARKQRAVQVTPLQSRTFGTWTLLTAIVRPYAAYNITEPALYSLAQWTFAVAWLHFIGEWQVWKTVRPNKGSAGPLVIATASSVWMAVVRGGYLS